MEPSRRLLARMPPSITRWVGYRSSSPKPLPSYGIALWSFIAAFCGISVIQATFRADYFVQRGVPSVIASYVRVRLLRRLLYPFTNTANIDAGRIRRVNLWLY